MYQNEKGQMAIFIALFFQVIFVFFAMAINVGLVVHDKINLQNSVDMAAYYGAMKQGEVLNQIAHINYQMRQNYKLFVWRYRVLGTMGNQNHPWHFRQYFDSGQTGLRPDTPTYDPDSDPPLPNEIAPSVCVSHDYFQEVVETDPQAASICLENSASIPNVQTSFSAAGLISGAANLGGVFTFIKGQLKRFCLEAGLINWFYSARIYAAYRIDGLLRKNMIRKLAGNLSLADPLDVTGQSIREGVRKTFEQNLTNTNLGSIQSGSGQFEYLNGLQNGDCSNQYTWLPEIKIVPTIMFNDWSVDGVQTCGPAESIPNLSQFSAPGRNNNLPKAFENAEWADRRNSALGQQLSSFWAGEPQDAGQGVDSSSSVGFEKNPWCMVYTGIQATTVVRKPFDPTGGGVTLTARGFAKPFGGRVGPWYGKNWARGSGTSQATNRGEMVDSLLPVRNRQGLPKLTENFRNNIANYSRYPGDQNGINSFRAFSAMSDYVNNQFGFQHRKKDDNTYFAVATYDHLGFEGALKSDKDPLARTHPTRQAQGGYPPRQRSMELAATAPDVFDMVYYSVEPSYYNNYFSPNVLKGGQNFNDTEQLWDFGSAANQESIDGFTSRNNFTIQDAIERAKVVYHPDYEPIIDSWNHLLNSWHQRGAVDYSVDNNRFGVCETPVGNPQYPTPGNCLKGGRVGYSVKMISRDYLESSLHQLSGSNGGAGAILNPPSQVGF